MAVVARNFRVMYLPPAMYGDSGLKALSTRTKLGYCFDFQQLLKFFHP